MFPNFKEFTILVGNTRNITPLEKAQHCKVGIKQVASVFLPDHGRCQQRWKYNSEVGEWPRLKKKSKSGKEDQFTCTTLIWFTLRVFPSSLHICTFLISLCSASQSIRDALILGVPGVFDVHCDWCSELERESGMRWDGSSRQGPDSGDRWRYHEEFGLILSWAGKWHA